MRLRLLTALLLTTTWLAASVDAQMATISSNGIRGYCTANCTLDLIETDVRISRHEELEPETEVRVELQQVLTGPHTITNADGTTSIEERTTFKVIGRTNWHRYSVDQNTTPSSIHVTGAAEANPGGDRSYGTFRLVGKMRTLTGEDRDGEPEYTIPVTFIRATPITLRCSGCGGKPGGQGQGGPGS